MENKVVEGQGENPMPTIYQKNQIGMPLIALSLDLLPVLIIFLSSLVQRPSSSILLLIVLSPIAGLIMGVASLSRGKGRIGLLGKVLAIIAIALPLALVAFIVVFFMGVATGIISLM